MADEDLLVTISGAALSLLFYETVRSVEGQMGFLLGETLEFLVKTYTDSDNQVETVEIHNNIQTIVTCPLPDLLQDSTGRINKEKLKDFIRDESKHVIGWFCFRRNFGLAPTMRDKILHKELASHFSGCNGSREEFFLMCRLTLGTTTFRGTHKFLHVFLRRKRGTFEPVPSKINNLGMDACKHDGSDYKRTPTKKSSDAPEAFASLIEPLEVELTRMGGLESAMMIQNAAEQYLDRLIPKVRESDLEVAELEEQVRELRHDISMRKLSSRLKLNGASDNTDKTGDAEKDNASENRRALEMISPPRIESLDNIGVDTRTYKDHSTSTSQPHDKSKSAGQDKGRTCLGMDASSLCRDGSGSNVSEMRVDMGKTRNRIPLVSDIVRQSICREEPNEARDGTSRGRMMHQLRSDIRRGRHLAGPMSMRSLNAHPFPRLSDQEPSEGARTSHQVSYSQTVKKNLDSAGSSSQEPTENH